MHTRLSRKLGTVSHWRFAVLAMMLPFAHETASLRADDALVAEAQRERGTVRWYTALNVGGSKPVADAFEKKYPFIKVAVNRLSNERILNRILTEAKSNAPQFDVFHLLICQCSRRKDCWLITSALKLKPIRRDFLIRRAIGSQCIQIS